MKKNFIFCLLLFSMLINAQTGKELKFQTWALKPPMGWNSWDCYGPSVVESEVKANADYMATNLKQYGWEYVIVDIRWYVDNQTTGTYNAYANSTFVYDQYGRYIPSPTRFPSAANGAGFKPLADYIHSKGLKFGIHIMRGVPKIAVTNNLPIKDGNGKTAANIYTTADQCTWLQDNYTVLAANAGAQEYYNSLFELYASWGVDFVKVDDLSRPYHTDEINMIRKAIDRTGRPILLSMSPGETPVEQYDHVRTHANMWRTVDDFWDNWSQLNYQFNVCNRWAPYIAPGTWPDADMLPLGKFIRGERATNRYTNFTQDEQYTLMTLWTIFKSPLMFGGNLPDNTAFTKALITNDEVLAMHKSSVNNQQWFNANDQVAWTADDPNNGDKFVALFNNGGDGFISTKNLLYRSGTISRLTDNYGVNIDIPLPQGTTQLFLIVNDGGDGYSNDHADWVNPTLYKDNGDSLKLTDLTWEYATAGWGTVTKNKSISGGTLTVKGFSFANGIGTHSKSAIFFPIPTGYTRFKAFAGLDKGGTDQTGGATVEFAVANQDPTVRNVDVNKAIANSGRISRTNQRAGKTISADITGATKLYLVVTDAGDNYNYDHADWINPTIYKPNGDSLKLTTLTPVSATSGWDVVHTNKSLNGNTLTVNGKTYTNGYGVNSYSTIQFSLPAGYTTFKSFCGFDDEVLSAANGVSVEFMAFTQDPANTTVASMPVDLHQLGFTGNCLIRDMWARKDSGTFSGTQFVPAVNNHGAKLYRISALNRSFETGVSLNVASAQVHQGDTVLLNLSVQKTGSATAIPTGSFVVYHNDTVVGVLPVDNSGKATYTACSLGLGTHSFTAKYSGNAIYAPQTSNSISIEVKNISSAVTKVETSNLKVVRNENRSYLTGLNPGDEVTLFNTQGQLLGYTKAQTDIMPIRQTGVVIIKVKSGNQVIIIKTL
ncbi:MAG: NPCBM/NEW2 domain-containing protein [Bacteroidota bacterium]|nr:NPCBM/NEW2 domain-containing protein [Bacteroidota bacterium]